MNLKYYFYILESSNLKRYYGHTNNLARHLVDHSKGRVKPTKNRLPLELVYFEEFQSRSEAFRREVQFKNGKTRKETVEN